MYVVESRFCRNQRNSSRSSRTIDNRKTKPDEIFRNGNQRSSSFVSQCNFDR